MRIDDRGGEVDIEIVEEAASEQRTLRPAKEFRRRIVILAISMPCVDGIQVTELLRGIVPEIRMLGLAVWSARKVPNFGLSYWPERGFRNWMVG